jgi:ankyrin repeat protein
LYSILACANSNKGAAESSLFFTYLILLEYYNTTRTQTTMASLFYQAASQKNGQIDALELFSTASAKAKADLIKETNDDQWNALHWAAQHGNPKLVADLILANASKSKLKFAILLIRSVQAL